MFLFVIQYKYLKLEKEDERLNVIEIKEGDVFSNYKDLCQALGITPKSGGKSKQLQLKDIERYLEYKKEGRYGFLITKVFKEPQPKLENMRNTPPYVQYMELYLLQLLKDAGDKIAISSTNLAHLLLMINDSYSDLYKNKSKICDNLGVGMRDVYDFMSTTNAAYKNTIKTILNRLEKKNALMYKETYIVSVEDEDGKESTYEASDIEMNEIISIKRRTMLKYGDNMQQVYEGGHTQDYYEEVNLSLYHYLGILFCYKAYVIYAPHNFLEEEYRLLLDKLNIKEDDLPQIINEEWSRANLLRLEKKQNKAIEKFNNDKFCGLTLNEKNRQSPSYLHNGKKLNDKYVKTSLFKRINPSVT